MDKRQPRRISLSDMREIVNSTRIDTDEMFYMSKHFGVSIEMNCMFRKVMTLKEPLLIDDCRIGLLKRGEADITVNLINYRLKPGMLAYVGSGSIVQINSVSDDMQLEGMVLRDEFLNIALHGRMPKAFCGEQMNFYIKADEDDIKITDGIIHAIWDVVHKKDHNRETVYGLVSALLHYYDGLVSRDSSIQNKATSREREVFERFIGMVNRHCREERALSYYAGQLCLTERYLGTLVKQASGITAKEWLDRAVITTAKVMLRHSDKQVSQISDELHFPNNSFFCKYFRRLTGMTPSEYRET